MVHAPTTSTGVPNPGLRAFAVAFLVVVCMAALGARLVWLQIIQYQYYQKTPADTPRDIHAIMAPLIGVINQGLKAGLNTADLLAVHDQVVQTAAHEAGFMAA